MNPGDSAEPVVDTRAVTRPRPVLSVVAAVWILWWTALTLVFVVVTIAELAGADSDRGSGVLGGSVLAILAAMLAGTGVLVYRLTRKPAAAIRPAPVRRGLPHKKSAARVPVQRLDQAETALRNLITQLGDASVPQDVVDAAWHTATETAARLRVIAAKLEAVEAAIAHAPDDERAALEDGAHSLLTHLERGIDGYRELIAAAGHLVLAGSPNPVPDELVEATDHLAGLAAALRELSGQ